MALRRTYSLRALLVTALAVCLTLAYFSQARDLRRAVEELRVLRDETGRLSVGDRSKVHAIAVATREPNTWQWRLFIPEGHRYSWNLACEDIPLDSVPDGGTMGASNEPYWQQDNEVLVTATLRQSSDQEWLFSVDSIIGDAKHQMYGASLKVPAERLRWMRDSSGTDGQTIGDRGTEARDPHGPIILFQRRPCQRQPNGTYLPSQQPTQGLMIWLEEF